MLYTVSDVSRLTSLSKVSIYNKLKLKELEKYIVKKQGVIYIQEEGLSLIKESLNLNNEVKTDFKNNKDSNAVDQELSTDMDDLNIKTDYLNYLKTENDRLWKEIEDKNRQLKDKDRLLENFQVMMQSEKQSRLQLEAAREERERKLDTFISEWRQDHREQENKKGFFKKLFK